MNAFASLRVTSQVGLPKKSTEILAFLGAANFRFYLIQDFHGKNRVRDLGLSCRNAILTLTSSRGRILGAFLVKFLNPFYSRNLHKVVAQHP